MTTLRYVPADPGGVVSVSRLRLYSTAARTGTPVVDVGPAVAAGPSAWEFTIPDGTADGTYFTRTTVVYTDTTTQDDVDDTVTLPLAVAAQLGDPLAPWVDADVLAAAVDGSTPEDAAAAAQTATDVLYALSGRRFPGLRIATLRVGATTQAAPVLLPPRMPWLSPVSRIGGGCCPTHFDPMLHPIREVVRLTVGDTEIPAEQVKVENRRTIKVVRGAVADPLAVNYWSDETGTYSLFPGSCGCRHPQVQVTFTWGAEVPAGGLAAARLFATELLKALGGDQSCRLPGNVVNVQRQGVTVLLDPATFLDKGRTGLPLADAWLAAVNPHALRDEPMVWWPESPLPDVVG